MYFKSFLPLGLPKWERMTKDFGFCDSTCLIVGRVAEVKKKFTLDSGRIHDCVLLDRNVEVCSHKYT